MRLRCVASGASQLCLWIVQRQLGGGLDDAARLAHGCTAATNGARAEVVQVCLANQQVEHPSSFLPICACSFTAPRSAKKKRIFTSLTQLMHQQQQGEAAAEAGAAGEAAAAEAAAAGGAQEQEQQAAAAGAQR